MTEAGEEEGRTVTFDPEDAVVYTAAGLIVCGVVCMVVGYTVPGTTPSTRTPGRATWRP